MILDYVDHRLPRCIELIRAAESEEGSNGQAVTRSQVNDTEAKQNIIDACELDKTCGREKAIQVINQRQDILNLLKDITHTLISDAPRTKKDFLKIIRKTRQVTYYDYKSEQHSKQLRLGKEGALILRSILAKESKHTGK